jgi:RNA polymerase sigma-70 factor (ECF subfamily)
MKDDRAAGFERHRSHLMGIAYRMLGEMGGAEDIVQDAWLRWNRADEIELRDPRAWLSAVTVRLALDALRSARVRRETYVGPWLPEPIVPDDMRTLAADGPAARAELASDLSLALLLVLERLSPEERAAFVLHDAFDCDYRDIAATLEKSEEACRKLVSRARERVRADRPRQAASPERHRELLRRFSEASAAADVGGLVKLFSDDVVLYTDGGGRATAALNPIFGASKSARFILGVTRKFGPTGDSQVTEIDISGAPGLVITVGEEVFAAITLQADGDKVSAVYVIRNPDKLARFARALSARPSFRESSPSA